MKFCLILLLFVFSWSLSAQDVERLFAELKEQQQVVNALNTEIGAYMDANADLAYVEGLARKLERAEEALRRKRQAYEDALSDNPYLQLNANVLEQLDRDGKGALPSLNKNTVGPDFYKKYTGYLLKDGYSYYLYPAALHVETKPVGAGTRAERVWRNRGRYVSTVFLANDSLLFRGLIHVDFGLTTGGTMEEFDIVKHRAGKLKELSYTHQSEYTNHLLEVRELSKQRYEKEQRLEETRFNHLSKTEKALLEAQIALLQQQIDGLEAGAIFAVNLATREHFAEAWKSHLSTIDGHLEVKSYLGEYYFKFENWALRKNPETDKE